MSAANMSDHKPQPQQPLACRARGRPSQERYFRVAARLKVPVGKWLKISARIRKLSMSRLVEEIIEAEMARIGLPEEGP
jgi:hypothetical protein